MAGEIAAAGLALADLALVVGGDGDAGAQGVRMAGCNQLDEEPVAVVVAVIAL